MSAIKNCQTVSQPAIADAIASAVASSSDVVRRKTASEAVSELILEFCSDADEWHALQYGLISGWQSVDPGEKFDANCIPDHYPPEVKTAILKEYHYYNAGFTLGRLLSNRVVQAGGGVAVLLALAKLAGVS